MTNDVGDDEVFHYSYLFRKLENFDLILALDVSYSTMNDRKYRIVLTTTIRSDHDRSIIAA